MSVALLDSGIRRRGDAVRRAAAALVAVLLGLLTAAPGAAAAQDPRQASTWLPYWDTDGAYGSIVGGAHLFRTVSPFWYRATSCTTVEGNPGAGSQGIVDGLHERGIAVVPTITATLPPAAAIACLGDPAQRAQHVQQVLEVARRSGYDGVELNYENLALTTDPRVAEQVRAAYSAFAVEACDGLRGAGRTCVHTVMARTDDSWSVWRGKLMPAVYDYRAIGAAADAVRVMAYDDHAPGTAPGPVAPWAWVHAVAAYSASTIPAGKAELGIPLYGRDWGGGRVGTLTAPEAEALAARHGVPVRWDEAQHAPTFRYTSAGSLHTVWFDDARAVADRAALARSYGLRGAYWAAGQEDGATWSTVAQVHTAVFWDVLGDPLRSAVERLAARGVVQGGSDGAFRPAAAVTRGQMAALLSRGFGLPAPAGPAPFPDAADSVHREAVAAVWEAGIAGGTGDGRFRPHDPVTRGQMATFLARALRLQACEDGRFPDVAAEDPHRPHVCAVARAGIAQGFGDGTYRPALALSRGQMATLLVRALGA
jgi:spore germination protein